MASRLPFVPSAIRTTVFAISTVALAGLLAASVRLLPWFLAKSVPLRVALPFARGLVSLALEVAMVVGLPLGWALASYRFWERGEARTLALLGERPLTTLLRLLPLSALFTVGLCILSVIGGRETTDPGQVASRLIEEARVACSEVQRPSTMAVPFTEFVWLCRPNVLPRLFGPPPLGASGVLMSATDAQIAGDFRQVDLFDVHLLLPGREATTNVQVEHLRLRGLAPWAHASTLPVPMRVLVLALVALLSGGISVIAVLENRVSHRIAAFVLGALGPLLGLGLLRLFEREGVNAAVYLLAPAASALGTWLFAFLVLRIRRRRLLVT